MLVLRSRHSSLKELERNEFFHTIVVAQKKGAMPGPEELDMLKKRTLVTAFYHTSTRTRHRARSRHARLGVTSPATGDAKMTRAGDFYQESIQGHGQDAGFYGDVIVMPISSRARRTSREMGEHPDHQRRAGWGEHPTPISPTCIPTCAKKGALRIEMAGGR